MTHLLCPLSVGVVIAVFWPALVVVAVPVLLTVVGVIYAGRKEGWL